MLSTESTIVRAFTKRRATKPPYAVSPPPPPLLTQEAFQRRQAALRQMGLIPTLSLSQQEAQLDTFIPPSTPVVCDSEADKIKNEWVTKNNSDEKERFQSFKFGGTPPPSPPLTPLTPHFAGDENTVIDNSLSSEPTSLSTTTTTTISTDELPTPLTPLSDSLSNVLPTKQASNLQEIQPVQDSLPKLSLSPITSEFLSPESPPSPALLQPPTTDDSIPFPLRSRSPSLAASDSKSTLSTTSRSRSNTRAKSPLRFLSRAKEPEGPLPPLPVSPTTSEPAHPESSPIPTQIPPLHPQPPQRKKTVFARFKRANTVNPSSVSPQPRQKDAQRQTPSRSKSLFTSVKKSVFGFSANSTSAGTAALTAGQTPATLDPISFPLLPSSSINPTSSPSLSTPAVDSLSTVPVAAPPAQHSSQPKPDVVLGDKLEVTVEENVEPAVPIGSSAAVNSGQQDLLGKVDFPAYSDDGHSDSNHDCNDRERSISLSTANVSINTTSRRKGNGIGIGISLILNRERTKSSSPTSPPPSPLSGSFLSPPASPTSFSTQGGRLRGRLARKGTVGSGTDGLLSVWGGVTGLLGGAPSMTSSEEGADTEVRQALAPTIHNQASILHHMSSIEDEETRRVTELAFM